MVDDRSRQLIELQTEVLERVAYGERADAVARLVCERVEHFVPEATCSVLRIDGGGRLRPVAAPSLPDAYSQAIDGVPVGPVAGSCGTAAWRGEPVEVADIAVDPLWADYKHVALGFGLRACWSSPIKARDGRVIGTFAFYYRTPRGPSGLERDIVARCTHLCAIALEHEEIRLRLEAMAFEDTLSGLPNRARFNRRLGEIARPGAPPFALLLLDLDHLKEINDTLGHSGGDALIRTIAARLSGGMLPIEAFRLGGDEFAVIAPGCASVSEMAGLAAYLSETIRLPFAHEGHSIVPFATLGGALFGKDGGDAETLCQNADFALYHGKDENRGGFVAFDPGMRTAITRRIQSVRDLGDALADGRVFSAYQPIVRLDTAEIVGLEALARIRSPDGAVVPAGEFHQATTDPRVGGALTEYMIGQVARDLRAWLDMGIPFQHVGVNVAGIDFQRGDLDRRIGEAFEAVDVPLRHVILEVNETVFMGGRDNQVARAVEALRARGMRVALDDFGTGFASLTHLLNFPVDIIKIDKSFVKRLVEDRQSRVIVEALIRVAHELDMRIVAEGVETEGQGEKLRELGCVLGQGYRFGRPAPFGVTTELLRRFAQRPEDRSVSHRLPYRISA